MEMRLVVFLKTFTSKNKRIGQLNKSYSLLTTKLFQPKKFRDFEKQLNSNTFDITQTKTKVICPVTTQHHHIRQLHCKSKIQRHPSN